MNNAIGIGTDIVEIRRIADAIERSEKFVTKIFSDVEIDYFKTKKNSPQTIAGCFCAKEAVIKAVGTGFGDITIHHEPNGRPYAMVESMPDVTVMLSISHCKEYATATAYAMRNA